MTFEVYILQNIAGTFYVGSNLIARLQNHNRSDVQFGKYTRKNGPWKLMWAEQHKTRSSAMKREKEIKQWKSAKLIRSKLLSGRVPPQLD